jgi:hypothetical protein
VSADWQVGDLALCVDAGPRIYRGGISGAGDGLLREGRVYHVTASIVRDDEWGVVPSLKFAGLSHPGFDQDRFRKILPDKHESCEPEFVTLLKRTKRTVKA